MSDLSREARALLARARSSGHGMPDEASLARARGAVLRRVGVGAAAGVAAAGASAATNAAPAAAGAGAAAAVGSTLSLAVKGIVVAALLAGGATAAVTWPPAPPPVAHVAPSPLRGPPVASTDIAPTIPTTTPTPTATPTPTVFWSTGFAVEESFRPHRHRSRTIMSTVSDNALHVMSKAQI